jgi:hypothetical protein
MIIQMVEEILMIIEQIVDEDPPDSKNDTPNEKDEVNDNAKMYCSLGCVCGGCLSDGVCYITEMFYD